MPLYNPSAYNNDPIAMYTHSGNKEAVISSVDYTTDTFTSIGHPFENGDIIFPTMNYDAGNIFPVDKFVAGATLITKYYVINKTADTFQVSYTVGGTKQDLTLNNNVDFSLWHFECNNGETVSIDLPSMKSLRLKIVGKSLYKQTKFCIVPNNLNGNDSDFLCIGVDTYTPPYLMLSGDISVDLDVSINYNKFLTIKIYGTTTASNTATGNVSVLMEKIFKSPKYRDGVITSINFQEAYLGNGSVIEVYRA